MDQVAEFRNIITDFEQIVHNKEVKNDNVHIPIKMCPITSKPIPCAETKDLEK